VLSASSNLASPLHLPRFERGSGVPKANRFTTARNFATSQPIIDGRGRQHASVFVFQNGSVYSSGDTESNAAKV